MFSWFKKKEDLYPYNIRLVLVTGNTFNISYNSKKNRDDNFYKLVELGFEGAFKYTSTDIYECLLINLENVVMADVWDNL